MFTTPTLWLFLLSRAYRALSVATTNLTASNLECTFAVNQLEFDLCPLLNARSAPFDITFAEETPPTYTKHVYAVSFGGPLKRDGTLPAELQCPEGTQICLTVINTRPNHPSEPARILQVIPVAGKDLNPTAILGKKEHEDDPHAPLQVTLHGDLYLQQKQKATFIFSCDHAAEETSKPTLTYRFNGTHAFSWRTKHACHKPLSAPHPGPTPDPDPPEDPPKDPESDPSEPPARPTSVSRVFWMVILSLLVARFLLYLHRRHRQFRHLSSSLSSTVMNQIRPLVSMRFVPWAPYTGKEQRDDRFSSASYLPAYPELDNDEGEEVPLTPTPGGTFSRNSHSAGYYGSF
ncbi:putative autophagy-related protein 27 [Lyophyllum shimeji]|uniref:Autophagy-related protein 27 n=1 Tax=Lyophyllum shimeji TaxID=47721 RepID=A0A9P3UMR4_LYOSH|nr:putative autophagy-related protein 27 [Lyophyllum shimeji]